MGTEATAITRNPSPRRRWAAWARLLRAPNLLTAPGDPLAGALLAAGAGGSVPGGAAAWAAAAALALYGSGLVGNDLADTAEDARERPDRPLPAGAVSRTAARGAAILLAGAGLICATLAGRHAAVAGAILLGLILLYNGGGKRSAAGPWIMGACRTASLWMGAAAAGPLLPPARAATAALGLGVYIALVSRAARGETGAVRPGRATDPAVLVLALGLFGLGAAAPAGAARWALAAPPLFLALAARRRWQASAPGSGPAAIGMLLGALPFLQAFAAWSSAAAGAGGIAAGLVAAGLLNTWIRRRIPAS